MSTVLEDCRQLSAGTIGALTGVRQYKEIDRTRAEFCSFVDSHQGRRNWETWMEAWESWKVSQPSEEVRRLTEAFTSPVFPCNPIPFANGLADYIRQRGSGSIQDDDAKRILFILIAQAYGQLATVDLCDEYRRLSKEVTL